MKNHFLFEIGCEELPPKNLFSLVENLKALVVSELAKMALQHGEISTYATPRRLAIYIKDLADSVPTSYQLHKGPAVNMAFDNEGKPTPAALGFARKWGCEPSQLAVEEAKLVFRQEIPGKSAMELMPTILAQALAQLPLSKSMRWGNDNIEFVRPVHWLVMLYGNEVVPAKLLGQTADRHTYGHRFHHPQAIALAQATDYPQALYEGKVIADFQQRKALIQQQILTKAEQYQGQAIVDADLLEEVTGLVEWPVALVADFDKKFLQIPAEALITSMKVHQKCFPLMDKQGGLLAHFITISNIESKNPTEVITGNARVMAARLADAAYFYHTDCQQSLLNRLEDLKNVIFQAELGSLHNKALRLADLSADIAKELHANVQWAEQAGLLAKADLLSQMVNEFPELQGIMGYYYALHDGLDNTIALAIKEHYLPRFAGDSLPQSHEACAVALAERLDKLVGIFGINQLPSGDKDPFALRRAALGLLRIILEKALPLDLAELLQQSFNRYQPMRLNPQTTAQVYEFILERLRAWYLEQGISSDIFNAVAAIAVTKPYDFHLRIQAVQAFTYLPQAKALATANKRVSQILKKEEASLGANITDPHLFRDDSERQLAQLIAAKTQQIAPLYATANYTQVLTELATLQPAIDAFFDNVMVMVDDIAVRTNRLALLQDLRQLFTQVADISQLQQM